MLLMNNISVLALVMKNNDYGLSHKVLKIGRNLKLRTLIWYRIKFVIIVIVIHHHFHH